MFTNITRLKGHIPDNIYDQLLTIDEIDGPKRCSHFLGQCVVESGNFTTFTENLNYSAEGLHKTFKKYFPTLDSTTGYARQPEKIANRVYANRMGNRDEQSGDGWYRKGVGALQITGADNQKAFFKSIGLPENSDPKLIATTYSVVSAAWYFTQRKLWVICDQGVDDATILKVTKLVNGGDHGYPQRLEYTKKFYNILTTYGEY